MLVDLLYTDRYMRCSSINGGMGACLSARVVSTATTCQDLINAQINKENGTYDRHFWGGWWIPHHKQTNIGTLLSQEMNSKVDATRPRFKAFLLWIGDQRPSGEIPSLPLSPGASRLGRRLLISGNQYDVGYSVSWPARDSIAFSTRYRHPWCKGGPDSPTGGRRTPGQSLLINTGCSNAIYLSAAAGPTLHFVLVSSQVRHLPDRYGDHAWIYHHPLSPTLSISISTFMCWWWRSPGRWKPLFFILLSILSGIYSL